METVISFIKNLGACDKAIEWLQSLPAETTSQIAWENCNNGTWLLWLLIKLNIKSAKYHEFIIRVANRTLEICDNESLKQVIVDKENWCSKATEKELNEFIVWKNELAWNLSYDLVWKNCYHNSVCDQNIDSKHLSLLLDIKEPAKIYQIDFNQELKYRADDLRELFNKPELKAKKKK